MLRTVHHVKKNDVVQVRVGKERGKTGKVLRVLQKKGRVLVEKINMVKRHTKAGGKQPGGIIEKEASLPVSNILLYCEKCARGVRAVRRVVKDKKKVRFCKRCDSQLEK